MTLLELIKVMEAVAINQPAVSMLVRDDIYKLNKCPSCRYGVFAWTEGTHRASRQGDVMTYAFTLFYVDRLNADRTNLTEIHSVGCEVLGNILRVLSEEVGVDGWTVTPFSGMRFADECAGVYASVELEVMADVPCGQTYDYYLRTKGAFDMSWSDAFQVWVLAADGKEIYLI